jgi:hypothetical protein
MNLQPAAEAEQERRTRSKLEPHREAIFTLRRKHWTYAAIAKWLDEHGVTVTLSSVHRYCQRAVARRPRASTEPQTLENMPFSIPQTTTTQAKSEPKKHRFNLDI